MVEFLIDIKETCQVKDEFEILLEIYNDKRVGVTLKEIQDFLPIGPLDGFTIQKVTGGDCTGTGIQLQQRVIAPYDDHKVCVYLQAEKPGTYCVEPKLFLDNQKTPEEAGVKTVEVTPPGWEAIQSEKLIGGRIRSNFSETTAIVVIQIERANIIADVTQLLDTKHIVSVISYPHTIDVEEFSQIAKECYDHIVALVPIYEKVQLVLSGPAALNFQLGQLLCIQHNVELLHWAS